MTLSIESSISAYLGFSAGFCGRLQKSIDAPSAKDSVSEMSDRRFIVLFLIRVLVKKLSIFRRYREYKYKTAKNM
jgi:hypothetical protein